MSGVKLLNSFWFSRKLFKSIPSPRPSPTPIEKQFSNFVVVPGPSLVPPLPSSQTSWLQDPHTELSLWALPSGLLHPLFPWPGPPFPSPFTPLAKSYSSFGNVSTSAPSYSRTLCVLEISLQSTLLKLLVLGSFAGFWLWAVLACSCLIHGHILIAWNMLCASKKCLVTLVEQRQWMVSGPHVSNLGQSWQTYIDSENLWVCPIWITFIYKS